MQTTRTKRTKRRPGRTHPGRARVLAGAVLILACFIARAAGQIAPTAQTPSPEPGTAEVVATVPLPAAISAVAAELAALGDGTTVYALEPSQQSSLLDGYVAHMLAAHLQARGLVVRRFAVALPVVGAHAPETLPKPFLQELAIEGGDLFVHAATAVKEGERFLAVAVYGADGGRRLFVNSRSFLLPQDLKILASGERARPSQNDSDWLELFDVIFAASLGARPRQRAADGGAPDDALALAEAHYLFGAGLWPAAARAFLAPAPDSSSDGFMRAIVAFQLGGEPQQAASLVRAAVTKTPDSGPLWALRGWLSLRQRHPEDAVIWLEQARLCDLAREGLYRYAGGLAAAEQGRQEAAGQEFARAATLLPNELFAQLRMARFHRDRAELPAAIEYYRHAAATPHPTVEVWSEMAVAVEAAGNTDEAISALREAFRLDAGSLSATRHLAALLKRKGQHEEALDVLRRAADANPRNSALLALYGDAALDMWRIETAEKAYEESVAAGGDVAYTKTRLAALFAASGRGAEARALLAELVAARPDYVPARIQLGRLLGQLGRTDDAASILTDATTTPEHEVSARLALAELHLQTKRPTQAVACAQIAASSRPDGQTYALLAEAFLAAGDLPKGDTAVAAALEKDPLSPSAHLAAARLLQAKGQTAQALHEAVRAREIDPYCVEAFDLAGSLYLALGDFRKCAESWQQGLALNPWHAGLHRRLADILGPRLADWTGAHEHLSAYVALERARTEAAR